MTDDPIPTLWGQWEINIPYQLQRAADGQIMGIPWLDVSYGLLPFLELNCDVPVLDVEPVGLTPVKGVGDISIGAKVELCPEKGRRPELAFAPEVLLPTGDADLGLGAGAPVYILPILALKSWGDWAAFGNAGWVIQSAAGTCNYAYYGAALTRELGPALELGGEVFGNTAVETGGPPDVDFNLGASWTLSTQYALLFSAGRSFRSDGPSLFAYAGFQMTWGKAKEPGLRPHRAGHHPNSP